MEIIFVLLSERNFAKINENLREKKRKREIFPERRARSFFISGI